MKKLTREQWDRLDWQYKQTPDPNESFQPSGEHYKLAQILRELGHTTMTRHQTVEIAAKLLENGWKDEKAPKKKDGETSYFFGLFGGQK